MNNDESPNGVPSRPLPKAASKSQQEWREYCSQLLAELDALHTVVDELREEKHAFASLIPLSEEGRRYAAMSPEQLAAISVPDEGIEALIQGLERGDGV